MEKENNEIEEVKLKNGKKIKRGDVVFITMTPNNNDVIAKGRFIEMTKDDNVKLYIIDPKYNLVDIEVKQNRIVRIEKPN